tara:strand:- start:157 stop:882 length:726 start_codon:yes stop_codon:yes gene_type:complete
MEVMPVMKRIDNEIKMSYQLTARAYEHKYTIIDNQLQNPTEFQNQLREWLETTLENARIHQRQELLHKLANRQYDEDMIVDTRSLVELKQALADLHKLANRQYDEDIDTRSLVELKQALADLRTRNIVIYELQKAKLDMKNVSNGTARMFELDKLITSLTNELNVEYATLVSDVNPVGEQLLRTREIVNYELQKAKLDREYESRGMKGAWMTARMFELDKLITSLTKEQKDLDSVPWFIKR